MKKVILGDEEKEKLAMIESFIQQVDKSIQQAKLNLQMMEFQGSIFRKEKATQIFDLAVKYGFSQDTDINVDFTAGTLEFEPPKEENKDVQDPNVA